MRNIGIIIVVFFGLSACMSFTARDKQRGHLYTGVNSDFYGIKCAWVKTSISEDDVPWYLSVPLATGVTVLLLVDTPFSMVADTVFIPFDLNSEKSEIRYTLFSKCE